MVRRTKAEIAAESGVELDIDYGGILDVVEKRFKLTANMTDRFEYAVSSGLLVSDLILGGGLIAGGMYTFAGMEQSAKSTYILNFLRCVLGLEQQPNVIQYLDGEGSLDPRYFNNMFGPKFKDKEVFGVRDSTGVWVIKPRIRYYPENRGELLLTALNGLLRRLPDKELLDGKWYYVFENTVPNRKIVDNKHLKSLFSKFNKFYVPTENTAPQAIFVVDSWASLITEKGDDEDSGEGLGAQARMFAEELPKVKGKLRRKGAILLGVNQLREKPMARGDPRYEPGGNALKFYSDVRVWQTARAIPHGKGRFEEEPSVTGSGTDTYTYLHMKAIKNKLATPYLEGWARLWVADTKGVGRGFCPVWDVFTYLKMTGQATGTMKKMSIVMSDGFEIEKLSFFDLKSLILLTGVELKEYCTNMGLDRNPRIRERCITQMRKGIGTKLYFETLGGEEEDDGEYEEDEEE